MAEELGLSPETCRSEDFVRVFSGNRVLDGMDPHATCYGGHQFGHWAGQLGDGRAINLGELAGQDGKHWTLQLKGAEPTPYARSADGLAVLRSSVREFLCSEAMFHLGVPTTRALSLVLTGEEVVRDMFYDGHPAPEPGAIVCRVAPSFTRFGSFEIFASRGEIDVLRQLADYTIRNDFPHLGAPLKESYLAWFEEVCRKTAELIVHWMRVGFVHGVMNTDNMSVLGLTIDYGPYGWLDHFDPDWTPNTTDAAGGRYRFGHQSQIALWNLVQLANTIHPLVEDVPALQAALEVYPKTFEKEWTEMMASKLGFESYQGESDSESFTELQTLLRLVETDMTIFYRRLVLVAANASDPDDDVRDDVILEPLMDAFYAPDALTVEDRRRWGRWLRAYRARLREDGVCGAVRRERMDAVNPKYVFRNYMAQLATDQAETGDFSLVEELLDVLRYPYDEQPGKEEHAQKRPDWARNRPGCSMLSCSS